jgi:superfamily II DNA or RNA helicase
VTKNNHFNNIKPTFLYGVIYVYSILDENHKGRLKIGGSTTTASNPTIEDIELAAHERIKQQTQTADVKYILEHAELAVTEDGVYFSDTDVHNVLLRSGYERKSQNVKNSRSEWFEISLDIAKKAIQATKEKRQALTTVEKTVSQNFEFVFRPNQLDAIDKTTKAIKKKSKHFLWNAKMRFGKTSAAMQVAKVNEMKKVLIATHRPSVSVDWQDDFNKVFAGTNYEYSSRTQGENISTLAKTGKPFVYFASLQDLRLSKRVLEDEGVESQAAGFEKNEEIFDTTWDMLIIDEAHEGTQSNLGEGTFSKIKANFTLLLSGTPFNILHKHEEENIYTWDYVMEQEAKLNWDLYNPGIPSPYAELPALSIFTYDVDTFAVHIGDLGENFHDSLDGAFKFHEFFRVHKDEQGNDTAEFVHKSIVKRFLDLLVDDKLSTKFPYATEEYRSYNKHALWLLPNRVKVIEAMENLLKEHSVFGSNQFGIVNISGDRRDDEEEKDAKNKVTKAIKDHEYTITLTGQRLTTGASIPEWTAIFMMSDTSSASSYLQTAFRCQTPAKIDGKIKTQGYVFDFAPDRTLKLVAEAIELNHKSGKTNTPEQKEAMRQFLNFCPIIAAKSGSMEPYDVGSMLRKLKEAIIDRVSRNGFDDPKLYNDELLKLDELAIKQFNDLKAIIGVSADKKKNEIEINNLGMTDLITKQAEEAERKKKQKKELTQDEKEALKKLIEARKQKKTAISILRAVSIRMPMLVYGANVRINDDVTLEKFINLVDEESWSEFMPAGLTKQGFGEFTKYYDEDVFKGVARNIRRKAYDCDKLLPTERIQAIAEIFSTFKNPDKETVLTPWKVVNLHMTIAFGGHDFCSGVTDKSGKPEWKSLDVDTSIWEQDDTKILEINSKSGLYPLLAAYNLYSRQLKKLKGKKAEDQISRQLWSKVLTENIYVLCKTPMAERITLRTLAGYSGAKANIVYIADLMSKLQHKDDFRDYNLRDELLERLDLDNKEMKFTAVIGNPPYQENNLENNRDNPIYHRFMDESFKLSDCVSLITPARFLFNIGQTPLSWNEKILSDTHFKVLDYQPLSSALFPNTDIKGGIIISLRDVNKNYGPIDTFLRFVELESIVKKVSPIKHTTIADILHLRSSYKLTQKVLQDHPSLKGRVKEAEERSIGSNIFDKYSEIFLCEKPNDKYEYVRVFGRQNNQRTQKWVKKEYIDDHPNIFKWKVFVAKSNGTGEFGEKLSIPEVGEPYTVATQTFISFGSFDDAQHAENLLKYLKTKFARALLGTTKVTQDNAKKSVWKKIPLQDFTKNSDIDWSQSIPEIDKQLYAKYGLNKKEIDFIESKVKAMA